MTVKACKGMRRVKYVFEPVSNICIEFSLRVQKLVNDEGLPIMDISEPAADTVGVNSPAAPFHEPDLIPVSALSDLEREERRRTQDRILDMLEEEERIQLERDEEEEKQRQRDDIRKRKEAAKAEMERLRAAKEMQKKMGKALLKNIAESREKEEQEQRDLAEKQPMKSDSSKPKKTVTFANPTLPDESSVEGRTARSSIDWGDVSPARLRSVNRAPLITRDDTEAHPMKRNVVERHPASYKPSSEPLPEDDSDDEPLSTSSLTHDEYSDMPHESRTFDSDADDDDDNESDEDLLEEGYDWDSAHHHREVALEYYKKRHTIGAETARAMTSHTHDDEEWNEGVSLSPILQTLILKRKTTTEYSPRSAPET